MRNGFKKTLLIIALGIFSALVWFNLQKKEKSGIVVILNGPSASGKSSIQKEFQFLMMPNLWVKLGIDSLFDHPMPDITPENMAFWQKENSIRWVTVRKNNVNQQVVTLSVGDQGDRVAYGMNTAIAGYAQSGCNLIVDYIAYKKEWLNDLQYKLRDIQVYWVKVDISLETLEQREKLRATSPVGHARSHYDFVHWNVSYDLEVNSEEQSAKEMAQKIQKFIEDRR